MIFGQKLQAHRDYNVKYIADCFMDTISAPTPVIDPGGNDHAYKNRVSDIPKWSMECAIEQNTGILPDVTSFLFASVGTDELYRYKEISYHL